MKTKNGKILEIEREEGGYALGRRGWWTETIAALRQWESKHGIKEPTFFYAGSEKSREARWAESEGM